MGNRLELYDTIMKLVGQSMRMNDLRNVTTFAWMVVGLLISKTIHLGQWGLQRTGNALAASKERQISRWLHNPKLKPAEIYRDFVIAALLPWTGQEAILALDSSVLWERYVIIRVSLIYRGRALPLAWKVLDHSSASVSFGEYKLILEETSRLLSAIAYGQRLLTHLWLDPEPDPQPVYASRKQARTSTVCNSATYFYD